MKKLTLITAILLIANLLSAQWVLQNIGSPNSGTLNDIFFIDQDHGWAVSETMGGGEIFYTNDSGYTWDCLGLGWYGFNSVFFTDQNKGWVVGDNGIILHTVDGGENWEYQESGTGFDLQSVFFVDSLNGWIAGTWCPWWDSEWTTHHIILHTDDGGITWVEQALGNSGTTLNDIFFINDTTGWAIGEPWGPGILFTNDGGNTWQYQYIGYWSFGTSIYFKDEYNGWYAGDNIYHTSDGGATWEQQLSDTIPNCSLNDISFLDSLDGWAVGNNGIIFHTVDGGENWAYQESGTTFNLMAVCAVEAEKCWICGDNSMILYGPTEKINADLYVSPTGNNNNSGLTPDDPFRNIYAATLLILADSNNPHTIYLGEGTYGYTNNEVFPVILPDHISLEGVSTEDVVLHTSGDTPAIKIDNTINNNISYLTITGGSPSGAINCENSDPLLENLKITGSSGCGIYCSNANPMIYFSVISGNQGNGISCSYSDPNIQDCNIKENTGNGISCSYSDPNIQDCNITGNTGSGISCSYSDPNVQYCNISGNLISGIYCTFSNPVIQDVYVTGNSAGPGFMGNDGGGIWLKNSNPTIRNSYIVNNTAQDDGGGIYLWMSNPIIQNVIISGNSATDQGSGVFSWDSNPSIYNSTISGNVTGNDGGGIKCYESNIELFNSILWENSPEEISFEEVGTPNSIEVSYSDIQGGETGIVTNGNGTINWLEGNIDEDPLFEGSGDHPYMLSNESPCVNTGTPDTTGLNLPELDLAGNPRLYGGSIDMGAYENQEVVITTKKSIHQLLSTEIEIYPNPAKNKISVSVKDGEIIKEINIYNQIGQRVIHKKGKTNSVDVSKLRKGMYIIEINIENMKYRSKLIIE